MSPRALIAGDGSSVTDEDQLEDRVAAALLARGIDVITAPSLYHIPEDADAWAALARSAPRHVLCRMHPRPAAWVLHRHGIAMPEDAIVDLRSCADCDEVLRRLGLLDTPAEGVTGQSVSVSAQSAERWYPVIDRNRCVNCGHCREFCIFGVYESDAEGAVRVVSPDNCKPGCPACARICPHSAIMFPLHPDDPGIQGAPGASIAPDAAARRMYYRRTRAACPVCGQAGDVTAADSAVICDECGRRTGDTGPSPVLDQIDALIDQLDRLVDGN